MNQPLVPIKPLYGGEYNKQVEYPVVSLYAGISQQPSSNRFPNQVSDASNVDFSVLEGMTKRAGTRYERLIDNSTPGTALNSGGTYRMHSIRRDDVEQYDAVYGYNANDIRLRIFEFGCTGECTVNFGTGVETYLNLNSPTADDLRFVTIADATFIVNTKVAVSLETSTNYTLSTTSKNADVMTGNTPGRDTYHRALANGVDLDKGYWQYTPGGSATSTFPTIETTPDTWTDWVKPNGSLWSASGEQGFRISFQRKPLTASTCVIASVGGSTTRFTLTLAGAFTNYTYEAGDQVKLQNHSVGAATYAGGLSYGWATVVSRDSANQITIDCADPTPSYVAGKSVKLVDGGGVDTIDIVSVGAEYEIAIDFSVDYAAGTISDMHDIAARIQQEFRNLNEYGVTVAWVPLSGFAGKFRIGGPWRGSDATIFQTEDPISAASSIADAGEPFSNDTPDFTITAGASDSAESVRVDVKDRWTRAAAPNQTKWRPDPDTMPVRMTRDTYVGNGTTGATFSIAQVDWNGRYSGDEVTNPAPDLFVDGQTIADISYINNRLVLAGQEKVHMSQSGDIYNFFKDDEAQTVDSDPVTISLTGQKVSLVQYVVPYRDGLHLFCKSGQKFEAKSDGPITPSSIRVTPTMFYNSLPIRPELMDGRIVFLARDSGGDRTKGRLMEYVYDDLQAQNIANDLTAHAAKLFDSLPIRMTTIPELSMSIVLTTSDDDTLYVHRSYFINNQRQQSAWTKYDFHSGYRITDVTSHQSGLRILVEKNSEWHIEALKFEYDNFDENDETGADFTVRLDSLYYATGSHSLGTTTWTLPFNATGLDTAIGPDGVAISVTPSGSTVTKSGNYATGQYAIGRAVNASVEFSKQYIRQQSIADIRNFPIIRRASFHYRRAGSFTVAVDRPGSLPTLTHTFTPKSGNTIEGFGTFDVFGVGPADQSTITLNSNNGYPFSIQQVQFEAHVAKTVQPS